MDEKLQPIKGVGWLWAVGLALIFFGFLIWAGAFNEADHPEGIKQTRIEPKPSYISLNINSDPPGADVYLNWVYQGQTPLKLRGQSFNGILVLMKNGMFEYRTVDVRQDETLMLNLRPEGQITTKKLLLLVDEDMPNIEGFGYLRRELIREGLSVTGPEEDREFKREMERAGGISNRAFRVWARAKFGVDKLVSSKVTRYATELGQMDVGYKYVQDALSGMYKVGVKIDMEIIDLRTGEMIASSSAGFEDFCVDKSKGFRDAMAKVSAECVRKIKQKV